MSNQTNLIGVTDLPLESNKDDLLKTNQYSDGLKEFIIQCKTPMSIALQGTWGSGKTSILNLLFAALKEYKDVKCIYINTWQFSQAESTDLFDLIVTAIMEEINSKKTVEFLKTCSLIAIKALSKNLIDDDALSHLVGQTKSLKKIKDNFTKMVKEEEKRIVIMLDDLDRLSPKVAVELLEAVKLFLDVPECVFILAVDSDVVVKGVRAKYGEDVDDQKCKDFFDKIVQLPFHMPVENYDLKEMLKQFLKNDIKDETVIESINEFTMKTIGTNPRTMKRLVNSFLLLKTVMMKLPGSNKDDNYKEKDYALLFGMLCIQSKHMPLYNYLLNEENWDNIGLFEDNHDSNSFLESMNTHVNSLSSCRLLSNTEKELLVSLYKSCLLKLRELIKTLYQNSEIREEHFKNIVKLSSVTSSQFSQQITSAIQVKVGKKLIVESSFTKAYIQVIRELLLEAIHSFPSKVEETVNKFNFLTFDANAIGGQFEISGKTRVLLEDVILGDRQIYLGTKSGTSVKKNNVSNLCKELGKLGNEIVW